MGSKLRLKCVSLKNRTPSFLYRAHTSEASLPGALWKERMSVLGRQCSFLSVPGCICLLARPPAISPFCSDGDRWPELISLASLKTFVLSSGPRFLPPPPLENAVAWALPHPPRKATSLNFSRSGMKGLCKKGNAGSWAEAI